MTPESPIRAELQPLLDALCEETITPEQLLRLEELVLAHPEAQSHYVRFMSFYADLIRNVVGLPERLTVAPSPEAHPVTVTAPPSVGTPHNPPIVGPTLYSPSPGDKPMPAEQGPAPGPTPTPATPPSRTGSTSSKKRNWGRWRVAAAILLISGLVSGAQFAGWVSAYRDTQQKRAALETSRAELSRVQAELSRVQAEQQAAEQAARKELEAATTAEQALAKDFQNALEAARKAIAEKDFVVRLTGPARIQPGAPNKWQIETLRRGAIGRPKSMEVVVKDAKDTELFRETHDKPVGVATLDLPVAVWEKVKPGADLFLEVTARTDDGRKSAVAERLPLNRPVYVTHLVTDKPLYKPGETIRFRSLTLDRSSLLPPSHDLRFRFRLRDPGDAIIPLHDANGRLLSNHRPVLGPDKKPVRGIGVGEYALPAEAPGGEYKLELLELDAAGGKETLIETRKFIVNNYVPDVFEKTLEFDGKSYGAGDVVRARVAVSRTAGGPMANARANVVATVDGREFFALPSVPFTTITENGKSKVVLDLQFKVPSDIFDNVRKDVPPTASLSVNVRDGSDTEPIVRPIPLVTKTLSVTFFPEGGDMIDGIAGRVYFQVRTPLDKPADLKGYITDGTNTVAEVATLTDAEAPGVNRGHGVFTMTPKAGTNYFLKLTSPSGITEPTKNGFPLPAAKADGVALTALDPVTARGAPVRVRVQVGRGTKSLHVGAYARGRLISHKKLEVAAGQPADLTLQGDEAAGGVTRVTVFEEPKADGPGRAKLIPQAERLVYRAPGEQLALSVAPDKARYTPGGKVRLDLAAANEKGAAAPAILLVAVVNRSVITMADNKTDRLLPTHFLLSGDVKHPAELEHADFLLTDHPKAGVALDLLLGTQGWRRFVEQTGTSPVVADRADVDRLLVTEGQRTSAPVELLKLEEQRVTADFRPRMESLTLARVSTEAAHKATQSPAGAGPGAALAAAQTATKTFEARAVEAVTSLSTYEAWVASFWSWVAWVGILILFGVCFTKLIMVAELPQGRQRPSLATAGITFLLGVALVTAMSLMRMTKPAEDIRDAFFSSNANSTFSFVGSAIKPTGGGAERGMAKAAADRPVWGMAPDMKPAPPPTAPAMAPPPPPMVPAPMAPPSPLGDPGRPRTRLAAAPVRANNVNAHRLAGGPVRVAKDLEGRNKALPEPIPDIAREAERTAEGILVTETPAGVVREYAHQRNPALGTVRSDFTETVYWHPALVLPDTGRATIEFQLSDDIARYQVLVAGHTTDGRIGAITHTLEARKPFSVDPKLPLEIAHTDTIDVPVRVTNDSDDQRAVTFALTPTGLRAEGALRETIDLGPNGKGRRIVRMKADKLRGEASVVVEGTSNPAADPDSISRTIRIVPDGFPGSGAFSDMIESRARGTVTLPRDVVPGSLSVRLEVYPTSMADLVKGLDGLLREPHGCFEQTSTSNYPNTLILDYMNQTNQANPEAARRAKDLLDRGYAKLAAFECPDTPLKIKQGFEWFGAADMAHEALTAYGLLQFKDMARVHPVDPAMIKRAQEFLLSRRDGMGGFARNPRALDGFGGAPKHTTDAYIVWALVESDPEDTERLDLKTEIASLKAQALDENSTGGKDSYFVALTANILLHRSDREAAHRLLDRLQTKHLKDGAVTGAVTSITRSGGRDLAIETTALALLGWLRANDPAYATTVKAATQWISQQRGGYGGFGSTQSTIMALKALTLHAKKSAHPSESGELVLRVDGKMVASRRFSDKDVEVIGLDVEKPETAFKLGGPSEVEIVTDAKQPYPFSLTYSYTTLTPLSAEKCAVKLGTKLTRTEATEGDTVPLSVTVENRQKQGQGMAVAIIGLPAGLKVPTDLKQLTDLREKQQIGYFEVRGRELILYWRELAPEQKIALSIDLVCDVPGIYRGPASRGYLYYDADHKHWVEPLSITIAAMVGKDEVVAAK